MKKVLTFEIEKRTANRVTVLKDAREIQGMTANQVAWDMGIADAGTYRRWESRKWHGLVHIKFALQLKEVLGVDWIDMIGNFE